MTSSAQMCDWSVGTVQQWFRSLDPGGEEFGQECTAKVVAACAANNINGAKLKTYKTYKEVATALGISKSNARTYFSFIGKRKMEDIRKKANTSVPSAQKTSGLGEFVINIFGLKSKRIKLIQTVTISTTILEVKEIYFRQEIAPTVNMNSMLKRKFQSIELYSGGVKLILNSTLGSNNIRSDNNLITVKHVSIGGTFADSDDIYRVRTVNTKKYSNVVLSSGKDCITLEGDEGGYDRAGMPCGHAIAPVTMFTYITSIFSSNENAVKIVCPKPKCSKEWDWQLCTEVADMTSNEYLEWTAIRNRRMDALRDEKKCPHSNCHALCTRKPGVSIFRMRCTQCSNSDWCWECGKPWNHSGLMICGNSACMVVTTLNQQLRCDTIQQAIDKGPKVHKPLSSSYSFLLPCPVVRACPNCLTVVHHMAACKHMRCVGCSKDFCWFCMRMKDDSGWPCGGHGTKCNPKMSPVQQFT